ncbi:MAG TPA: maltose ABC transporter permease MalF, partial [Anaerolineales bacterium]
NGAGNPGPIVPSNTWPPFRTSLWNMIVLAVFDAMALYITFALFGSQNIMAAVTVLILSAAINWVFLSDRMYPIRWLTPGLVLMLLLVIYPLVYTVYVAFTNYSDGHLLTKQQVIQQLTNRFYQPADAVNYQMVVYRNPDGNFLLLLRDPNGSYFTGTQKEGIKPFQVSGEPPASIGDYQKVPLLGTFQYLSQLEKIQITNGEYQVRVTKPDRAQQAVRLFTYDPAADTLTNRQTGMVYKPVQGTFVDANGKPISDASGFSAVVGLANFRRVVTDSQVQGPFFQVFIWTVTFAGLTVLLTFSLGLLLALVLNDPRLPSRTLFRSLAIIPYTIPGFISVLIWVGLLNPYYGPFNLMIKQLTGISPDWFSNGALTKIAILMINTWLGFPYMMLINLGALQSIPMDMYEAAELDGAGRLAKFRYLTLPLLLISIGPLLIGTFAFNFNNFTVIDLVNEGGPPIVGTSTPAGQTDILISYTYRLAFSGGRGADFGMASTIAIIIFIIVATITAFNFRFTKQLEEVMR